MYSHVMALPEIHTSNEAMLMGAGDTFRHWVIIRPPQVTACACGIQAARCCLPAGAPLRPEALRQKGRRRRRRAASLASQVNHRLCASGWARSVRFFAALKGLHSQYMSNALQQALHGLTGFVTAATDLPA